ncbi:hypothetical protein PVAP13_2KG059916 [Panicum virgatum]|uniref:Uncharacterized protein n=1 Tax=Panicum virgatum TaxID=38727 RepID=A0A8T0W0M8_PANVG|nr:hypothetical protein PVAP13_2KG059916 [Panicum virgatum]
MLALRLQEEQVQAYRESLKAWEESWKPGPEPQRKNTKISGICNWERLFPVIAFANGLMLLVQLRALLPVHHFTNIVGAIGACLLLVGIAIYYRLLGELFRSTKGFSLHFAMWSMCMGFSLLVMCVLYLDLFLDQFGSISKHA